MPPLPAPAAPPADAAEAVSPVAATVSEAGEGESWPDAAAESAFIAEARERGEVSVAKPAAEVEEVDAKAMPPLNELVNRIPPEVRETLDDLFRARFVSVRRIPKRALK